LLGPPAISPDGSAVVTTLVEKKISSLWLRRFDSDRFERLAGTDGANFPFWSPDGRYIGFFADGKLKKMKLAGGETQALCDVSQPRGAAWSPAGFILYGVNYEGLFQVPEGGGAPVKVRGLDEAGGENSKRNPLLLPDGKRFLYFSRTFKEENRAVYLDSLGSDGGTPKRLVVPDGSVALGRDPSTGQHYLLFPKDGKLWAQPFDVERGELGGEPAAILDDVGLFGVSATGTMVSRGAGVEKMQITWFDRAGRQLAVAGPLADYWQMNLSPDDRLVAAVMHRSVSGYFAIWLVDPARGLASPFSVQTERSLDPVWARDSRKLYFTRASAAGWQLFERAVDAAEAEHALLPAPGNYRPRDVSPDGTSLVGVSVTHTGRSLAYSTAGRNDWRPLPGAGSEQEHPQFSPDGRWLAYDSNESGTQEIYVMEFPTGQRARRISVAGGHQPRWRRDGRELFFHAADDNLMVVDVKEGSPSANASALFKVRFPAAGAEGPHYSVSVDGQSFVAVRAVGEDQSRVLNVVFNWPQLLRRPTRQP
jgi:Tol biopolymer transport system component